MSTSHYFTLRTSDGLPVDIYRAATLHDAWAQARRQYGAIHPTVRMARTCNCGCACRAAIVTLP